MERLNRRHEANKKEEEMKITRRQLRRIIREVGIAPRARQSLTSKLYEAVIETLTKRPRMSGAELVDTVNQMHPSVDAELIYDFLDQLLDDGEVFFDVAEDEWSLDPTGISAEEEFENAGIRAREMMKRR